MKTTVLEALTFSETQDYREPVHTTCTDVPVYTAAQCTQYDYIHNIIALSESCSTEKKRAHVHWHTVEQDSHKLASASQVLGFLAHSTTSDFRFYFYEVSHSKY